MFPNQKELEKRFPAVSDEVFENRIYELTKELEKKGFIRAEKDESFMAFEKKDGVKNRTVEFGLWPLRHEPDEDFERALDRVRKLND